MKIRKNKKGFTLAETLIAMGILGLIAALIIPPLMQATAKNVYVAGLKKSYLIMRTATNELLANNSGTFQGLVANNDINSLRDKYCTVLTCIKKCVAGSGQDCFSTNNKLVNGTTGVWYTPSNHSAMILSNGMMVSINGFDNTCGWSAVTKGGSSVACGWMLVDVNGSKGPNTLGRDIFVMLMYTNGIVPAGVKDTSYTNWTNYCNPASGDSQSGIGCAGRVLTQGAINY